MRKRTTNLALTGIAGAVLAGGIATGVMAQAGTEDSATRQVAAKGKASSAGSSTGANRGGGTTSAKGSLSAGAHGKPIKKVKKAPKALLAGKTTASYFWDDGSGINGDTGAPAFGKPMQKGLFASPSWPLGTKVKVSYKGRSIVGFVGDRGPGEPSHRGVMLDLDTYTFRYLLDGKKPASKYNSGTGEGHLQGVKWEVLKWGTGAGKRGLPRPF